MIAVLREWNQIGEAHLGLARLGLPRHSTAEKAWDIYALCRLVESLSRDSYLLDLGCGHLEALKLLHAMGFKNLYGIDLSITWRQRLSQLSRIIRSSDFRLPFHLSRMDITRMRFPDEMFDLALSISTIEHGVDVRAFFAESSRILKTGGVLFLTTDYWEERVETGPDSRPFGLPWTIFDRNDVMRMVSTAEDAGFSLLDRNSVDLACGRRCVAWSGREYTFVCAAFMKGGRSR